MEQELKCNQVGMLSGGKWDKLHDISRRVYSADGLAPTVHTMGGGQQELKIIEPIAYDEQNGYIRQDGCVGTLTTDGSSPKHNNRIIEPRISVIGNYSPSGHNASNIVDGNGIAPTVMENHGTVTAIVEPRIAAMRGRNPDNPSDRTSGSTTEQRLEIGSKETSNTLTTVQKDNLVVEPTYRIRKLTERECFRLMGVKEEDFERVAKNQSTSSLYHLAGDSIVTTCLMAIFGELFGVDYQEKINSLVEELRK